MRKQLRKSRARQAKQEQSNPMKMTGQPEFQNQGERMADQNGGAADFAQSGQQPGANLKLAEATIGSPSDIQADDQTSEQATDAQTMALQHEMSSILHHLKHRRIVNDPAPTQKTHNTSSYTNTNFPTSSLHSQPKARALRHQRTRHSRGDADSPPMKGAKRAALQVGTTAEAFPLDHLESSHTTTNLDYEQRRKNQSRRRRLQSAKPFPNRENPRNSLALQALPSRDTIGTLNASKAVAGRMKADSSINIETHLKQIRVHQPPDEQFSDDAVEQLYVNSEQEQPEERFERKGMNRDLLKHTVFARQVQEQADEVEKINQSMFSEDGTSEIARYRKQIVKLRAKLNKLERERLVAKHAAEEHV